MIKEMLGILWGDVAEVLGGVKKSVVEGLAKVPRLINSSPNTLASLTAGIMCGLLLTQAYIGMGLSTGFLVVLFMCVPAGPLIFLLTKPVFKYLLTLGKVVELRRMYPESADMPHRDERVLAWTAAEVKRELAKEGIGMSPETFTHLRRLVGAYDSDYEVKRNVQIEVREARARVANMTTIPSHRQIIEERLQEMRTQLNPSARLSMMSMVEELEMLQRARSR